VSYWDSSALVKFYASEADSSLFEQLAASSPTSPVTSRFAFYEIRTTLERKEVEGSLALGAAQKLYGRLVQDALEGYIEIIAFSEDLAKQFEIVLARCFGQTRPQFIRTLDGIHVAAARVAGETEFVATDKRLREAALILGLKLFP
jgi:predicted nucleic acid-binding protein